MSKNRTNKTGFNTDNIRKSPSRLLKKQNRTLYDSRNSAEQKPPRCFKQKGTDLTQLIRHIEHF